MMCFAGIVRVAIGLAAAAAVASVLV